MESRSPETPELATRARRLGAALLDWSIYALVFLAGALLIAFGVEVREFALPVGGFALTLAGCTAVAIYQMVLIARSGQSIAKRWLGLRIVKVDGKPAGLVSGVLLRIWVPVLMAAALQFTLGAITGVDAGGAPVAITGQLEIGLFGALSLLPIFGPRRRALHDYIAGTIVVTDVPDQVRLRQLRVAGVFAAVVIGVFGAGFGTWRYVSCRAPNQDCDGSFWNGCEVNNTTLSNCGACGTECSKTHGDPSCRNGRCTIACFPGFADCDGDVATGCEAELETSNEHCGSCGLRCTGQCFEGRCALAGAARDAENLAGGLDIALPRGNVDFKAVVTHGPVGFAEVRDSLAESRTLLERCYGEALLEDPTLSGPLGIRLVISRDGSVSNFSIAKPIASSKLIGCVSRVLYRLTFAERSEITTVTFTLGFTR